MYLLLDAGNYRLKWASYHQGQFLSQGYCAIKQAEFSRQWSSLSPPARILLCNVAGPSLEDALQKQLNTLWQQPLESFYAQPQACGVRNAYTQTEQLGADRWAALIGAHHHYTGALCIVSCGTAITLDMLSAKGIHQGGLIIPGLALMRATLGQATQQISPAQRDWQQAHTTLGKDTASCVDNGALLAVCSMIQQTLHRHQKQQEKSYTLLLLGGDAAIIYNHIAIPAQLDMLLVYKGLLQLATKEP